MRMLNLNKRVFREDVMASTRFHRMLRRGREYGPGLTVDEALQPAPPGEAKRGIHFICLNANISRQFEFVQNAWLMSTKFNGLSEESDPLLGTRVSVGDCPYTGNFSVPREGAPPLMLTNLPQFITVRGGGYFFLPSLRALQYIAGENR
jgi:deferrochelatase/peroxidase EfeB